jgi:hypothetical protein
MSQTASEALLLVLKFLAPPLFVALSAVRFLRSVVGDIDHVDFLSPTQEASPSPEASSPPVPSSPAPPCESSFAAPSPSAPSPSAPSPSAPSPSSSLPSSLQLPTAVRPQVLSINTVQLVQPSQSSPSPSSPSDAGVRLTVRELLAQLGLPEEPSSLGDLQEPGLLPGYNSPTAPPPCRSTVHRLLSDLCPRRTSLRSIVKLRQSLLRLFLQALLLVQALRLLSRLLPQARLFSQAVRLL